MKIQVMIKSVYGKEYIYPVCDKAKIFADMRGHKTITPADIALIKELGYEVEVIPQFKAVL